MDHNSHARPRESCRGCSGALLRCVNKNLLKIQVGAGHSLIRFSEYGKGDAVANETEETRKKKATRRSPRGPQRGAQIDQRERSLDQRSVQGEPTLTSTRPLTVRFSRRSEPKTSARAVQYRENNSSRRDRELSEKKERELRPSRARFL